VQNKINQFTLLFFYLFFEYIFLLSLYEIIVSLLVLQLIISINNTFTYILKLLLIMQIFNNFIL